LVRSSDASARGSPKKPCFTTSATMTTDQTGSI
jgi:hypothetical protein